LGNLEAPFPASCQRPSVMLFETRILCLTTTIAMLVSLTASADESGVDFVRDIRPILSNHCFQCHGPDEATREAELRLDTPTDIDSEELLQRILSDDPDMQMPPPDSGLALTESQKQKLQQWVDEGSIYQQHWSFRPIARPAVPDRGAKQHPIDFFIERQLQRAGLTFSEEATRHTLIRRVYLDVIGLPPEPAELNQFLSDTAPGAYERMIDRVLQSPHYGEKWGRHWLDQARYADSNGYTIDSPRSMWPWRDWVIKAINDDMPFDQFTIEQLAGDLLPSPTTEQLVATGFHRNTLINQEGGTDDEQFRNESVVDRVNTTGAVWLGLTVGCAQCHTHKYDPLTHHEYYQLFAFFNSTADVNTTSPTVSLPDENQTARLGELHQAVQTATQALADFDEKHPEKALTAEHQQQRTELEKLLNTAKDGQKKFEHTVPTTMVMKEQPEPRPSHVLIRGDFLRKGDPVQPAGPAFLPAMADSSDGFRNRLDLARWLVSKENPLTPRVTVNRIWMQLFGRGLVETENDFGLQGTPPTHPDLLDWLAAEFMENGWSRRHIIRTILTSATYRQASAMRVESTAIDPLNKLLSRQSRVRVDAEIVRDLALTASGLLNRKMGGPGVYPPQPDGVYAFTQRNASWPTSKGDDRYRRGMYTFFMRSAPHPMLTTFDSPFFNTTCTRRVRSNTPLQSLTMANDEAFIEAVQALAGRLLATHDNDPDRIMFVWTVCFSRPPTDAEQSRVLGFVSQARNDLRDSPEDAQAIAGTTAEDNQLIDRAAWTMACRAILNLDEFITRE
jgi:hypothetical protein